jgi:hypothetical protein
MIKLINYSFCALLLGFWVFLSASAADSPMLEITTQGFSSEQPQKGLLGEYPRLRVRIEAPGRINQLVIRERSYEVDLAATRDKNNLHLFGLVQNPRSYPDVTLNLQNYINEKIGNEGEYEFTIKVTDKDNNHAEKIIAVHVHEIMPVAGTGIGNDARLLQSGLFALERVGAQPVKGVPQLGIYWKNRDNENVKIRITKSENSNTQLGMLDKSDFDSLQTMEQLVQRVAGIEDGEAVILTTARDKAAGEVFWVGDGDNHYILKVMESEAYSSAEGTVVSLKGYYKY